MKKRQKTLETVLFAIIMILPFAVYIWLNRGSDAEAPALEQSVEAAQIDQSTPPISWSDLINAAENDNSSAQFTVAQHYDHGTATSAGNVQDFSLALEWYERAGEGDHLLSQIRLAELYEDNLLTSETLAEDWQNLLFWYQQAALNGDTLAQQKLSLFYFNPDVGTPDHRQSYIWESIAKASGGTPTNNWHESTATNCCKPSGWRRISSSNSIGIKLYKTSPSQLA